MRRNFKAVEIKIQFFVLIVLVNFNVVYGQDYPLLYENSFEDKRGMSEFEFSDQKAWQLSDSAGNHSLELFGASRYELPVSSPFNIAVLTSIVVGSFILEVDVKQTSMEYPHRDLCIFFGMKNPTNYYYVHLSSIADPYAHSIFLVNDEPLSNLTSKVSKGIDWDDKWHKVRIIRDAQIGIVEVFFDDMKAPIMQGHDTHFDSGYIGFGSFDDTGMFDNAKLWGDAVDTNKSFFE